MYSSESKEYLAFDYHAIRLMIGLIAMLLLLVVGVFASGVTDSISWSYHTDARNYFVGFLFVIGAFLMSYKGHKPTLHMNDLSKFWNWVSIVWKGAINFRIWERKHEENIVGWVGGAAAWITAIFPTARYLGKNCPPDQKSSIHYIGAIILFSSTVYFCLIAFRAQAKDKMKKAKKIYRKDRFSPQQLRVKLYSFCGWGIVVTMAGLFVAESTVLQTISNITFWAETLALELFGVAWLIASQYLPVITDEKERQKLF